MKASELIGKQVEIDEMDPEDYYYADSYAKGYPVNKVFAKNDFTGTVMDVGTGGNVCITVAIGKRLFDFEDIEVYIDGETVDDIIQEWDWGNIVPDPRMVSMKWWG